MPFSMFFLFLSLSLSLLSLSRVKIQANKQKISSVKAENESFRECRLPEEVAMSRVNIRWTKDELSLAIMGFRKFGQNFKVKHCSLFHSMRKQK
jgi:hypothetical protein